jgi:hypothetical protein
VLLLFAGLLGVFWKQSMRLAAAEVRRPTARIGKPAARRR